MSSLERSRGQRTNVNFERTARAFDETAVPPQARAAKQEVKATNKADICGVKQAGWNSSTVPEGKHATRFPDRPMMRTLAQYDSHKRADYNFRAEQLENQDRRKYYPTTNNFEYNERHLAGEGASLDAPPPLARTEFVVNPTLGLKVRWDGSTGSAGDPHAYAKERQQLEKAGLEAALANSKRYQPKQRVGLVEREKAHLEEQRRQKAERRAIESAGGTWYTPEAPLAPADAMEMSMQVPSRRLTTWSLGGF